MENSNWESRLVMIPVNKSKDELKDNIYHCPMVNHTFRKTFKYLGAYINNMCFSIFEVKALLKVQYNNVTNQILVSSNHNLDKIDFNTLKKVTDIIENNRQEIMELGKQIFILDNARDVSFSKTSSQNKVYYMLLDKSIKNSLDLQQAINNKDSETISNIIKKEKDL